MPLRAIFVCLWKMVSVSVRYLFYQPMDEKNKTWTLRFPAKENPNMEKALFDWPIVLQYDVKAISRKFFGHEVFRAERSLNQPKTRCVCIRSINQSNGFISVRLLFLFCSRVFILRSYENRSNRGDNNGRTLVGRGKRCPRPFSIGGRFPFLFYIYFGTLISGRLVEAT